MRRPLLSITSALVALSVLPAPALAASITIVSPSSGSDVAAPSAITVDVARGFGESVDGVQVRLRPIDGSSLPSAAVVDLRCVDADGCGGVQAGTDRWGGTTLRPSGEPFTTDRICNGAYVLDARLTGQTRWPVSTTIVLAAPAVAVTELAGATEGDQVELTWATTAAPDARLLVQRRRADSTTWRERAELGPAATSYRETAEPGRYEYRVRTVRGDGRRADGSAVTPCDDDDRDLVADSAIRTITVASSTPSPAPSPTPTDGPTTTPPVDPDAEETPPGDPSAEPSPSESPSDTPSDGEEDAEVVGSGGDTSSRTGGGRRVAAPPAPPRAEAPDARAPSVGRGDAGAPAPAAPSAPAYFGQGDGFSEELTYDGVEVIADGARGDDAPTFVQRLIPGGVTSVSTLDLDLRRILTSVAGGLLMMTLALHLRRWARES